MSANNTTIRPSHADKESAYNQVEDRVHLLESTSPSYIKRLGRLEESIRPYEQKVQDVVNQLNDLKKSVEILKTGSSKESQKKFQSLTNEVTKKLEGFSKKVDDIRPADLTKIEEEVQELSAGVTKKTDGMTRKLKDLSTNITEKFDGMAKRLDDMPVVDQHQADINASVKTLLARVLKLEGQTEPSTAGIVPPSSNDLANALISRLAQGDTVDNNTLDRLREVMPNGTSSSIGDEASLSRPTPESASSTFEQASGEKQSLPLQRKRKRIHEQAEVNSVRTSTARQEVLPPRKRARAVAPQPRSGVRKSLRSAPIANEEPTSQGTQVEAEAATVMNDVPEEEEDEQLKTTPEVRRSSRTPKPNKKHASFLSWTEVRDRRKTS